MICAIEGGKGRGMAVEVSMQIMAHFAYRQSN